MARSRSPFVPMEERTHAQTLEQGARRGVVLKDRQEREVLLIHSQVRRIKREDEEAREHLLKLQLLETMPAGGFRGPPSPRASRSLSPLRRAGNAIPVGDRVSD